MIGRSCGSLKENDSKKRFKAKENKCIIKSVVFFEKIVTNAMYYCSDRFY